MSQSGVKAILSQSLMPLLLLFSKKKGNTYCTSNCPQSYFEFTGTIWRTLFPCFFGQIMINNSEINPLLLIQIWRHYLIICDTPVTYWISFFLNDVSNCNTIQLVDNTNGQKGCDLKYGEHMWKNANFCNLTSTLM